ncbi:hypothetical protein [Ignicoccus hospitalis]|uniref:Uncharacterized protein n=1 Tax=Ignicoccus hospitalis (strain KIN4/I / DSM 18386 / JCM 14125) TaxID=453591 RepID=A8AC38_IGNH4|nr:hypothetical protein [Ignicoccus hospitalis]ABU82490.1 hypothetical protein Igni_1314 [Ignicoccus hospitalis KIN4/I]HIH90587.1 hypothetical protein [Desulfurococcaceae archaeon]
MLTLLALAALPSFADIAFKIFNINKTYVINVVVDNPSEIKVLIVDGCGSSTLASNALILNLCKGSKALFVYDGWRGAVSCSSKGCCAAAVKRIEEGFLIKAFGRGELLIDGEGVTFLKGGVEEECVKKKNEVIYIPKCKKVVCVKSAPVGELKCKTRGGEGWLTKTCVAKEACLEWGCAKWTSYPVRLAFCEVTERRLFLLNPTPSSSFLLIKLNGGAQVLLPAEIKERPYAITVYAGGEPCASFLWR